MSLAMTFSSPTEHELRSSGSSASAAAGGSDGTGQAEGIVPWRRRASLPHAMVGIACIPVCSPDPILSMSSSDRLENWLTKLLPFRWAPADLPLVGRLAEDGRASGPPRSAATSGAAAASAGWPGSLLSM